LKHPNNPHIPQIPNENPKNNLPAPKKQVREDLQGPLAALREAARRVAKVSIDCRLPLDADEYAESFRPELMDVAAAWARGATFAECLKMAPGVFEGSLVRAVRRLEELLRQLGEALKARRARLVGFLLFCSWLLAFCAAGGGQGRLAAPGAGDPTPEIKPTIHKPQPLPYKLNHTQGIGELDTADRVEAAAARVRRDIIFAASLYL